MRINNTIFSHQGSFLATFLASFLIWIMLGSLLFLLLIDKKKKQLIVKAIMAGMLAWLITQIVKDLLPAIRPFIINYNPPLTLTLPFGASFPSSHAAFAFALATSVWLKNKTLGISYLIVALLVSWGRIISNVHFPVDILGGAIVGAFVSIVVDSLKIKPFFNQS